MWMAILDRSQKNNLCKDVSYNDSLPAREAWMATAKNKILVNMVALVRSTLTQC